MTISTLPRILAFDGVTDAGEYGATTCPHCDAKGRYIYWFITEAGERKGAMAGCIKLYPTSPLADAHKSVLDKVRSDKALNGWDTKILEAIEATAAGTITIDQAEAAVKAQQISRAAWVAKKYRR